jgi:hypothetical protein
MASKYFVKIYITSDTDGAEEDEVLEENIALGTASFMEVYPVFISDNFVKIKLYNLEIPNKKILEVINLKKYAFVMELCVPFSGGVYTVAYIWARIKTFFLPFGKTAYAEFYINAPLHNYNQNAVNFIQQWAIELNESFNWQSPATLSLYKQAYLIACPQLRENEMLLSPDSNPIFTLKGDFVKDEDDFYILMGEAFFGNKGYMGSNLHALNDMLITYRIANKSIHLALKPTLVLENYPHLLRTLGAEFMWHIDDIFNNRGFLIIKK